MKSSLFSPLFIVLFIRCAFGQNIKDLKVDTTISGFHLAANFQRTYIYTPNGSADVTPGKEPSAFSFTFMPSATIETAKKQIEDYINMARHNGFDQNNIISKDTLVNGNTIHWLSYTETKIGTPYKNIEFHGFYIKNGVALLFISGDMDGGMYVELFKKTFFNSSF